MKRVTKRDSSMKLEHVRQIVENELYEESEECIKPLNQEQTI